MSRRRRRSPSIDVEVLRTQSQELGRLVTALEGRLPPERLAGPRSVHQRTSQRLSLSGRHTVVAIAGATGSGKSSLFNAVTDLDLSRTGIRRPTTSELHACVWDPAGADTLLDWLGVPPKRRTARESALDGQDQARLHGLVLLDLPDFDSIAEAHRAEVDRLVELADQIIWVLDPQKYADRLIHERYLRHFSSLDAVTVVALNQVDRLAPADARRCAEDLAGLLAADGLPGVPLYLTSARTRSGVEELRTALAQAVASRQTALRRLSADVEQVANELVRLVGPPAAEDAVDRDAVRALADALAGLAGVPGVVDTAEHDYRRRGHRYTGWLLTRFGGRRNDPGRRLAPADRSTGDADAPRQPATPTRDLDNERSDRPQWQGRHARADDDAADRTAQPEPDDPTPSRGKHGNRIGLAGLLHHLADRVGHDLPSPWPGVMRAAATSQMRELSHRLDELTGTGSADASNQRPRWWRLANVTQWLLAGCALAGLLWLAACLLARPIGYHQPPLPWLGLVLLLGGLALGLGLGVLATPLIRTGAQKYRQHLDQELRAAITDAARRHVVAPVRAELRAYAAAYAAAEALRNSRR